jgi:hypothetical protein
MEGGENHEPPRFCIEVNVPRGGRKLAVLRLPHGATIQSVVKVTVDLRCKTVCFNQLFGDVNLFSIVLSKRCVKPCVSITVSSSLSTHTHIHSNF